jgi:hypothetical protein
VNEMELLTGLRDEVPADVTPARAEAALTAAIRGEHGPGRATRPTGARGWPGGRARGWTSGSAGGWSGRPASGRSAGWVGGRRPTRLAAAGTAGVAVAVVGGIWAGLALPSGAAAPAPAHTAHPAGSQSAKLTAWTVTKNPDGLVTVNLRELRDPAGLQRTLAADGVPASVVFQSRNFNGTTGYVPPACQAPNLTPEANAHLQAEIMPTGRLMPPPGTKRVPVTFRGPNGKKITGYSWAVPANQTPPVMRGADEAMRGDNQAVLLVIDPAAIPQGIGISIKAAVSPGHYFSMETGLVLTSPQCTGS